MNEPQVIHLNFETLGEMFHAPEVDAFDPAYESLRGVDRILEIVKLNNYNVKKPTKIVIHLSENADLPANWQTITQQALSRYCALRVFENQAEKEFTRRLGLRQLRVGVAFFGGAVTLSVLSGFILRESSLLAEIASQSFIVIGWVTLWHPAEVLLFDVGVFRERVKIYSAIPEMPIEIVRVPAAATL
jgi:hypothetical protein